LYGTMNQLRRMEVYDQFCRKSHSILLSTDLASRGLDFPNINWVIQVDCPIDVNTYIHRVGRTARFEKNGQALLIITQSESAVFLDQLQEKKIELENLKVNQKYLVNIETKLQGLCASNVELKESVNKSYFDQHLAVQKFWLRSFLEGETRYNGLHKVALSYQKQKSLRLGIDRYGQVRSVCPMLGPVVRGSS
jgi:superfamily II DNA/RNA helicase